MTAVRVEDMFNAASQLELQLRAAEAGPTMSLTEARQVWERIRDNMFSIVSLDIEYAHEKDIEETLWKVVFYRVFDDARNQLRKPGIASDEKARFREEFDNFLHEASAFYLRLIKNLAEHFQVAALISLYNRLASKSQDAQIEIQATEGITPSDREDKERAVRSCYRSLVYSGDLARYREQHSLSKRKDYSAALTFYQEAVRLCPENGTARNQIAVVATYGNDNLTAIYHYFRTLLSQDAVYLANKNVRILFEGALHASTLQTDIKSRIPKVGDDQSMDEESGTYVQFVDAFTKFHGCLFLKTSMDEVVPSLHMSVMSSFCHLVDNGELDADHHMKVSLISMAVCDMTEEPPTDSPSYEKDVYLQFAQRARDLALDIFFRLINTLGDLLQRSELYETPSFSPNIKVSSTPVQSGDSLQTIQLSEKAKKIIPSIRLWVKYFRQTPWISDIETFPKLATQAWKGYMDVLHSFEQTYQFSNIQAVQLQEDIELRGFPALVIDTFDDLDGTISPTGENDATSESQEWMWRVRDMTKDAVACLNDDNHSQMERLYATQVSRNGNERPTFDEMIRSSLSGSCKETAHTPSPDGDVSMDMPDVSSCQPSIVQRVQGDVPHESIPSSIGANIHDKETVLPDVEHVQANEEPLGTASSLDSVYFSPNEDRGMSCEMGVQRQGSPHHHACEADVEADTASLESNFMNESLMANLESVLANGNTKFASAMLIPPSSGEVSATPNDVRPDGEVDSAELENPELDVEEFVENVEMVEDFSASNMESHCAQGNSGKPREIRSDAVQPPQASTQSRIEEGIAPYEQRAVYETTTTPQDSFFLSLTYESTPKDAVENPARSAAPNLDAPATVQMERPKRPLEITQDKLDDQQNPRQRQTLSQRGIPSLNNHRSNGKDIEWYDFGYSGPRAQPTLR